MNWASVILMLLFAFSAPPFMPAELFASTPPTKSVRPALHVQAAHAPPSAFDKTCVFV